MSEQTSQTMEGLTDLQRRVKDALDLAIAAGAPLSVLEKLGASTGLVQAVLELPKHVLIPEIVSRAHRALLAWDEWQKTGRPNVAA